MSIKPKKGVYDLPDYVAGRTQEEIKQKYNLTEVYKLASNENILGPCKQVMEYLKDNPDDVNYYPDSDALETRNRIAQKYGVHRDNIILGNGTDQIIEMICDCFIENGVNIVIAEPNFPIYEKSALKCGGQVIKVPLCEPDFRQNIPEIINSMNRSTKAVFLASPYNPTGTILTEDEFLDVLKNTDKDVLIVMDEAYHEYLEDDRKIDTVSFIKENPNLVILRTFSKIYGLAGLRIGYGIADREIISILNKVRLPFNVNLIAQKAAVIALENDWYASRVRDEITAQKEKFYSFFDKSGIRYLRSHANFILVKTGDESNRIVEELLKSGFIVRPGLNLGIPGYIRVTISTPEINDRFLERFIEIYRMAYR